MHNEAQTHTTLASWALAVERTLQAEGLDSERVLSLAGIEREQLLPADARLPVATMWRLWRAAVEVSGNDAIGVRVAENLFPTHLNALMFAVQASDTIEDCIQRLLRYAKVVSTIGSLDVEYGEQQVTIVMNSSLEPDRPPQPVDALLSVVVRVIRDILQPIDHQRIRAVSFCRPQPQQVAVFHQFFGCPVTFDAPRNQIVLDNEVLSAPLPSANSELARVNDELLNEYLQRLNNESTGLTVRKHILKLMGSEQLNQEAIAERMHMSTRNLHRKLADEGYNFKDLLDSTRKELALRYLEKSDISIGELTFSLGFVDQSSFSRAFKRWTGKTPSRYRKQLNSD